MTQEELENQTQAAEAEQTPDESVEVAEVDSSSEEEAVESQGVGQGVTEASDDAEYKPHRKIRTGVVVSDKMDKSILVKVTRHVRHSIYKKYFFTSKKFMAHDEKNECRTGDTVRIIETRPFSAHKRWRLDQIVERAK